MFQCHFKDLLFRSFTVRTELVSGAFLFWVVEEHTLGSPAPLIVLTLPFFLPSAWNLLSPSPSNTVIYRNMCARPNLAGIWNKVTLGWMDFFLQCPRIWKAEQLTISKLPSFTLSAGLCSMNTGRINSKEARKAETSSDILAYPLEKFKALAHFMNFPQATRCHTSSDIWSRKHQRKIKSWVSA